MVGPTKLSEAEAKTAPPASGDTTLDKKQTVYVREGDIFLYDASTGQTQQITKTRKRKRIRTSLAMASTSLSCAPTIFMG